MAVERLSGPPVRRPSLSGPSAQEFAGVSIRTPQEFAARILELKKSAHIISPWAAVSSIASGYVIEPSVVVIDPGMDPVTWQGEDVYSQRSIHRWTHRGDDEWVPAEVSLRKEALARVLAASGVNVTEAVATHDARVQNYWSWRTNGWILDPNGHRRDLTPGIADLDLRDGSPMIGGWTPELWQVNVAEADRLRRAAKSDKERKKIRPAAIGGWTQERVFNARRYGYRTVASLAANNLAKNIGVHQKYTREELLKPFVCFQVSWVPDMSNPRVVDLVTAAHLGGAHLLGLGPGTSLGVIDVRSAPSEEEARLSVVMAPSAPAGAQDLDEIPDDPEPTLESFLLDSSSRYEDAEGRVYYFFAATRQGATFVTEDRKAARELLAAKKAGTTLHLDTEPVTILGCEYRHVLAYEPAVVTSTTTLPDRRSL